MFLLAKHLICGPSSPPPSPPPSSCRKLTLTRCRFTFPLFSSSCYKWRHCCLVSRAPPALISPLHCLLQPFSPVSIQPTHHLHLLLLLPRSGSMTETQPADSSLRQLELVISLPLLLLASSHNNWPELDCRKQKTQRRQEETKRKRKTLPVCFFFFPFTFLFVQFFPPKSLKYNIYLSCYLSTDFVVGTIFFLTNFTCRSSSPHRRSRPHQKNDRICWLWKQLMTTRIYIYKVRLQRLQEQRRKSAGVERLHPRRNEDETKSQWWVFITEKQS